MLMPLFNFQMYVQVESPNTWNSSHWLCSGVQEYGGIYIMIQAVREQV